MVRFAHCALLVVLVVARAAGGAQPAGALEGVATRIKRGIQPSLCTPPGPTEEPVPLGIPMPPLPPGQRPNFIVILTDDQGYDDLGINNPHAKTPNLDRFHRASTRFDNFYVTPQCAPTRAALLTGRDYLRTGTTKVQPDWHHINHDELTMGEIFLAAGYRTSHFGKWHNGDSLGYEAYQTGFQESWTTNPHTFSEIFQHNGNYVSFKSGLTQERLTNIILGYLRNITKDSSQPFFMFYPSYLMHDISDEDGKGGVKPVPKWYLKNFKPDPKYSGAPPSAVKAWALLNYLDDVIGRLLDFLDASGLSNTTYVMITGDNGPSLDLGEEASPKWRMPSGMRGEKSSVAEGGIRNILAVRGPGIPAGVVDSTMLSVTDILPTLIDLAGIKESMPQDALPFDGISFQHLLLNVPNRLIAQGRRGSSLATLQQKERMLFHFETTCWPNDDMVPLLLGNRQVWKQQPFLSYDSGGINPNAGLRSCIAVTYKNYKWLGQGGKLYRFVNGSHAESLCNEVKNPEMSAKLSAAAKAWWESVLQEPHSFTKPVFFVGLPPYQYAASTLFAEGVHERSKGVTVMKSGIHGFAKAGDNICWKLNVVTGGTYNVAVIYTSVTSSNVTVTLSVGPFGNIKRGTAPSLAVQLPPQAPKLTGLYIGAINLLPSYPSNEDSKSLNSGVSHEACLALVTNPDDGKVVFGKLAGIRMTLRRPQKPSASTARVTRRSSKDVELLTDDGTVGAHATITTDEIADASNKNAMNASIPLATILPGPDVGGEYKHLLDTPTESHHQWSPWHVASVATSSVANMEDVEHPSEAERWEQLRKRMGWPAGQMALDHMYSIYDVEGAEDCEACFPDV